MEQGALPYLAKVGTKWVCGAEQGMIFRILITLKQGK